jgi:hypothetical protein
MLHKCKTYDCSICVQFLYCLLQQTWPCAVTKRVKDPTFNINALGFLHVLPHYFFPYSSCIKIVKRAVNITNIYNYYYLHVLGGCS